MKPVKEFVRYKTYNTKPPYDTFRLLTVLDEAGYYSFNSWELNYSGAIKCDQWCAENCPDEYVNIAGYIYFDNKDHAILMKLSVER